MDRDDPDMPTAVSEAAVSERVAVHARPDLAGVVGLTVVGSSRCWRQIHDTYTLCAVMKPASGPSQGTIRYRRWSYEVSPGRLLLMEPGELHVTQRLRGTANFRLLQIDGTTLRQLLGIEPDAPVHWRTPVMDDPKAVAALCRSHELLRRGADATMVLSSLSEGLRAVAPAAEKSSRWPSPELTTEVQRATALLRRRFQERVYLAELADHSGVGRFRLDRLFKSELGLSPTQYLKEWRVRVARARLARGASVADAAHEAGFYDQAQFARYFKRAMGLTPRDYRRAVQVACPPPA